MTSSSAEQPVAAACPAPAAQDASAGLCWLAAEVVVVVAEEAASTGWDGPVGAAGSGGHAVRTEPRHTVRPWRALLDVACLVPPSPQSCREVQRTQRGPCRVSVSMSGAGDAGTSGKAAYFVESVFQLTCSLGSKLGAGLLNLVRPQPWPELSSSSWDSRKTSMWHGPRASRSLGTWIELPGPRKQLFMFSAISLPRCRSRPRRRKHTA